MPKSNHPKAPKPREKAAGEEGAAKPQAHVEITPIKDAAKKTDHSNDEETPGQSTVLMQMPSAFEQLVEKILKKHKI
jgi:hypothetical protein